MRIPDDRIETVRALNIDEQQIAIAYEPWESRFTSNRDIRSRIAIIREALGARVTRSSLVAFYQTEDVEAETKFIATMMWGYGAPPGRKSDSRGPSRVEEMFAKLEDAQDAIRAVGLNTNEAITRSYERLNKTLKWCGPNFFTKHFYFLGKAQGLKPYPLIFDNRVASGLIRIGLANELPSNMVQVSTLRTPEAYLRYLAFVWQEAERIHCTPDQIEFYLFGLQGDA